MDSWRSPYKRREALRGGVDVPEHDVSGTVHHDLLTRIDASRIAGLERLRAVFAADRKRRPAFGDEEERAPSSRGLVPKLNARLDFRGAKRRVGVEPDLRIHAGPPGSDR